VTTKFAEERIGGVLDFSSLLRGHRPVCELGSRSRIQPARELSASKCKEIQGKKLAFPWIPLAESGLFKGSQRKKQKNPPPA
jgi:hypothetical protein